MNVSPDSMSGPAVKLASMSGLLCATLTCGLAPLWAVKGSGRCSTDPALNLMSCFSGGVFLSSCLLDLMPEYLKTMNKAFHTLQVKLKFPLPEFILSMGFFLVLVMEQIVQAYKDQSGAAMDERRVLLIEPGVQSRCKENQGHSPVGRPGEEPGCGGGPRSDSAHLHVDPGSRLARHSFVLVCSLSLHAVLEGLAVDLWRDGGWAPGVYASLLLRRCLVAPSLTIILGRARLRSAAIAGCVLLFSLASPLGVALMEATAPLVAHRRHFARSTLEGLVPGALLYVTCVEILPRLLAAPRSRLPRLALLLAGFFVFTGTLFVKI
ncbi:hypothetical protein SKAU_G00409250 [Synaphobranchus kaupii]|uniref:Solute carrier family 39 member 1 n=1 Tax=Synaphobranchus kaupii TaxID=118154 RepID=A0A9Q1EAN4_SYNKA|nr:hypothetical protein SKAU_G00409250 [Synaphobranchus kaupii]